METQPSPTESSANAVARPLPIAPFDFRLTEHQLAELRETWIEPQIKPLGETQGPGVPDSPLHE